MPKKPPPNAFYYFMKEMQEEMRQRGQRVPGMKEMPNVASPVWNRMTAEEKSPYEERAKAFRRNRANTDDGRLTSDGIPVAHLKKQEEQEEENVRALETAVRNLVKTFTSNKEIADSSFFIIGFNIMVGTLEGLYLPNEIGIVEYSIREGIRNEYHNFIDPGPIPVGYTSTAKLTSETVHEIPIFGFQPASADYRRLYREVLRFLSVQSDAETIYIFCHPNEMNQFQFCLNWLRDHSGLNCKNEIKLASLAVLVAELNATVNKPYCYMSSAVDAVTSSSFDYSPNTLCYFHEEKSNKNCALGYCKRLSYVLSDVLCESYNVEPTTKHFPERAGALETVVWTPKGELRPVVNNVDVPIKPVAEHTSSTIVYNVRSKFDDREDYTVTPSALSEVSSVTSESIQFEDSEMFPSLERRIDSMSISSPMQTVSTNAGPSWAQVSGKNKPLRVPKSIPASMKPFVHDSPAPVPNSQNSNFGRSAGIGRGRGWVNNGMK